MVYLQAAEITEVRNDLLCLSKRFLFLSRLIVIHSIVPVSNSKTLLIYSSLTYILLTLRNTITGCSKLALIVFLELSS